MGVSRRIPSRGAASVEAVVALPVFVVLFVGVFFLRDLMGAKIRADQEVRRCAWEYSLKNDCGAVPQNCDGVVGRPGYGTLVPDFDGALGELGPAAKSIPSHGFAAVKRVVERFVVDYVAQAVTKGFDAEKAVEQKRPGLFGGGVSVVKGKYSLACNVPAQDQKQVYEAVWEQFKP